MGMYYNIIKQILEYIMLRHCFLHVLGEEIAVSTCRCSARVAWTTDIPQWN